MIDKAIMRLWLFCIVIFALPGCLSEPPEKKKTKYLNVTIILDLSDRLLQEGQIDRDKYLINYVYAEFLNKIRNDLYFGSKDKFRIVAAPQENHPKQFELLSELDSCYIDMDLYQIQDKKKVKKRDIKKSIDKIYDLARFSNRSSDYQGADIVGYLRDDLSSQILDTTQYFNKVIVITDGYLYVKDAHGAKDKYLAVTNLSKTGFAIFELDPKNLKSGELQTMKARLSSWIDDMKADESSLNHKISKYELGVKMKKFLGVSENTSSSDSWDSKKSEPKSKKKFNKINNQKKSKTETVKKTRKMAELEKNDVSAELDLEHNLSSINVNVIEPIIEHNLKVDKGKKETENWDCVNWNRNIGDKCDDKNNNTDNDIITKSCECLGRPRSIETTRYYRDDIDKDKLGDPTDYKDFENGMIVDESIWVRNSDDKCPLRKGVKEDFGCPKPKLSSTNVDIFFGDSFNLYPEVESISGDRFKWTGDDRVKIVSDDSKVGSFKALNYGLSTVNFNISNVDGYNESVSIDIVIRISEKQLEDKIRNDIIVAGQFDPGTQVPSGVRNSSEAARTFILSLCDRDTQVLSNGKIYGNDFGSYIDAKLLTKGSYVNDVKVNSVKYNDDTGKIASVDIQPIKFSGN